jgi:hypothetical protein
MLVYFRTGGFCNNPLFLIMNCIVVSQISAYTLCTWSICKYLVLPLVISYLTLDNAPDGPKHVRDITQQLVYSNLSVYS